MEITKARLKQIISEEIDRMNEKEEEIDLTNALEVVEKDEEGQSSYKMGDISEGEGMDVIQMAADTLFNSGLTAVESPEQAKALILGLVKASGLPLGALAGGAIVKSLVDAVKFLQNKEQNTEEK